MKADDVIRKEWETFTRSQEWKTFERSLLPRSATRAQREELRRAMLRSFYGGAMMVLLRWAEMGTSGATEAEIVADLKGMFEEAARFLERLATDA